MKVRFGTAVPTSSSKQEGETMRKYVRLSSRGETTRKMRASEFFAAVLLVLYCYVSLQVAFLVQQPAGGNSLRQSEIDPSRSFVLEPHGPLFHPGFETTDTITHHRDGKGSSSETHRQRRPSPPISNNARRRRRVLIIAAAPRTVEHVVALWTSLECFTADVDHVAISAPTWSQPIAEEILREALRRIPRFASGRTTLEGVVAINDRYDVGLWCDALSDMGLDGNHNNDDGASSPYDEIALLNDSVYALREYTEIFRALGDKNASMTSLNYSFLHPEGSGSRFRWLESVWRGFDRTGIRTFIDHSCRPASDPFFCPGGWWGRKGCIVENFERAMAWQFPRSKTFGLFPSDVPKEKLTREESFGSWVRHPTYWKMLVEEQGFPVSKHNWKGMIDSIDDERLQTCTPHLNRLWLEGFDFSVARAAI